MGRNKKINILPHHVKERLRHQNLQRLLDTVAKSVPSMPMKKETKAKKLRRIVLYMKFLLKKKYQLCTSSKQVEDLPSILHSAKNTEVQREKKSDDAPKMYSEKKSKSGQPQIVFLRKSSSVSSPNRLPSTITSENEHSAQICNSDPQKSVEVSFTNQQGREVFQLRNSSFDYCTPFDKKYLQYDIQPPYELNKSSPTLEHSYSNAYNKPRQANISQSYFKSTKKNRSEATSCPNTSNVGLYPNQKEYNISENGSDDSFHNTQNYIKPAKKNRSEATCCPNSSNYVLHHNRKENTENIVDGNGHDDPFSNTQSYYKPLKKNGSEATYCSNSSNDVLQKEYPEYIFNENDAFSYQYSGQSNGPTATESRSKESRINDSLIYPYLESDHQQNTSGIQSIESQRDKMNDETLKIPPFITVNPSTILYPNMYFGNATFVGTASKDVAWVQDPENYNLEFFSSGESAAMASSGEWFSSDETQKMSQESDNIALAAADIVESYDANRSFDIYRDSTGSVHNVEQFENIKKDFYRKSYLQRMSEESSNNALIEDIVEGYGGNRSCDIYKDSTETVYDPKQFEVGQKSFYPKSHLQKMSQESTNNTLAEDVTGIYDANRSCDIYKDSTDVEQFENIVQNCFYRESHLQNVLQKCDKNTQGASCDIYKDSTETEYDVEQFDHAQKSFYTESNLQNVFQKYNDRKFNCDFYKDTLGKVYNVQQFENFNQFSVPKSFYTKYCLQNMLQKSCNIDSKDTLDTGDTNSCDIYKDSTKTTMEQYENFNNLTSPMGFHANCDASTINTEFPENYDRYNDITNVIYPGLSQNNRINSQRNRQDFQQFYQDSNEVNTRDISKEQNSSIPRSSSNANDSSFISPEYNVSHKEYNNVKIIAKREENFFLRDQDCSLKNSEKDIVYENSGLRMSSDEYNSSQNSNGNLILCNSNVKDSVLISPRKNVCQEEFNNLDIKGKKEENYYRSRQDCPLKISQELYENSRFRISNSGHNSPQNSHESNENLISYNSNINDSIMISPVKKGVSQGEYSNVDIKVENEENYFISSQQCLLNDSQELYENSGLRISNGGCNSPPKSNGNLISYNSNINDSIMISPAKNVASQQEYNNVDIKVENEENYFISSQDCLLNDSPEFYGNSVLRISNGGCNSPQSSQESNENLISYNSNINDSILISPVKNNASREEYIKVDIKVENEENYFMSNQDYDSQEMYDNSGLRISNSVCNSPQISQENSRLNSSNAGFYSPVKKEEFGSSSFNIGNEKNEESYDLSCFGGETHMRNLDVLFKDYFDV